MNTGDAKRDARSRERMAEMQPPLRLLWETTIARTKMRVSLTEVLRTKARQKVLFDEGASTTMNSRHLTGHAFDFAVWLDFDGDGDLDLRWDMGLYKRFADELKAVAAELDIKIVWGGDWQTFKDGPHVELDRRYYP